MKAILVSELWSFVAKHDGLNMSAGWWEEQIKDIPQFSILSKEKLDEMRNKLMPLAFENTKDSCKQDLFINLTHVIKLLDDIADKFVIKEEK